MLHVRLGGGLRIESGGVELPPPVSRRARGVLAYLALNPGSHARAQLAARFWPDVLDESARTSLRAALSELRRALGPAAAHVDATRDTVALDGDDLVVDARVFEQALRRGDPAAALAACSVPILDGFEEDWAHEARQAHAERLAEALELLARASSDPAEAVRLTREQVVLDPLAEDANRRLIERLAQAGDRAAALAAGKRFADRLRSTLAIAPSPETRALLEGLRRQPAVRAPAPPPALMRVHDTEFVGRSAELERLRASWADVALHLSRRIVLVAGEPGVGKTRLVHRFGREVLDAGALVLLGRCGEEPLAPFEPFAEALRSLGAADVLEPGEDAGAGARHRLFDAVDAALSDLAAGRDLLLVIDDLHWADRGTLLLTSFLLRSDRLNPLLILGTYRDTELGRRSPLTGALTELRSAGALDRVGLRGLAHHDVAALARSLLGDDKAAARVHARTDGNAFFVEEVLRGLVERSELPESVRHAVGVRLSRLGDDANELLAAAAVLGFELDPRALAGTAALAPGAAEAALDEVLRARLLRAASTGGRFEFAHALVREAVYDELNVLRRARLHRRAADTLRELGETRHVEEIASHLFQAASGADAREASQMLARAGRRALDRLAYEDAAEWFERAHEALELAGAEDEAGPVLLARGDALLRAGEPLIAREAFSAARRLARRSGDATLLAEAALGFAGLGIAIVDLDTETIARLEEALGTLGSGQPVLRSRLQARLAVELYYAPDRRRSETLSADAVATARASGDPTALASALNARHVALWRPDRNGERLDAAAAMIAVAHEARDPHHELQARNWRVMDLFELGDMPACREEIARHSRLADELRLPSFQWYTPLWAAIEATLAGRFAEAERLTAAARDGGVRAGDRNAELFPAMVDELAHLERLEFHRTDMAFLQDKVANSPAGPAYQSYVVWILAGRGRAEEARGQLDDWMRRELAFDANWLSAQAEAAEAIVLLGDPTHAQVVYDRLVPYAGRPATAGRAACSYGAVDRHLGGLAAVLGRRDEAVRHLRTAIDRDAELGCVVWRLHGQRWLHRLAPDDVLAAEATATAGRIGLPQLAPGAATRRVRVGRALRDRDRELRRLLADLGVVDARDAVDQLDPLVRLEHRGDPAGGLGVRAVDRAEADVDVVVVVAHRERVVRALERHQRDDLVRLHRALQRQQALDREVGDRALALGRGRDDDAVDRGDVDRAAGRVLGHVARRRVGAVAAAQRRDRRLQPGGGEELERREHAAVDLAGRDVVAAALVDVDVRVAQDVALERVLAHQHDLADRGRLGVAAEERVALLRPVDRGRLEQLPAVEDRLRVDPRGAAAGGADLEAHVRGELRSGLADPAEDRAADDARALLERLGDVVLGVQAAAVERHLGVLDAGHELVARRRRPWRSGAPGARTGAPWPAAPRAARPLRRGGGRALGGGLTRARDARLAAGVAEVGLRRARGGALRRDVALGQREIALARLALLRERIGLGDLVQAGVEVGVAVGVLQLDEAAELARAAEARDPPVVDRDDRRALAAEDLDRAPCAVGLDDVGGVLAHLHRAGAGVARRRRTSPWPARGSGPG